MGKNIVSGLLNLIFKGVLDGLNTSLVGVVNAIESAISTVADSLKSGLSQLIKNLMNMTLFGAEMVGLSLLSRLIPTIKVPAWLDNLLKTVGQIAQTILVLNTGLLIGYSLMKNATQSLMKGFILPLIGFGVLPLIGADLIANGIKQLGNTLKNFLSPLIGGLLGSLLGNLLNGNKNHNINININFNGLPLLLALIPLMSTLAVIGNGANSLIKSLASILPGLIQTLVGRNKTVILPIIIPIIVPLILPILVGTGLVSCLASVTVTNCIDSVVTSHTANHHFHTGCIAARCPWIASPCRNGPITPSCYQYSSCPSSTFANYPSDCWSGRPKWIRFIIVWWYHE